MLKRWKDESWLGRIKLILFAVTPSLLLLIVAEMFASCTIGRQGEVITDPVTGDQRYEMSIGRMPWSRTGITPLNAQGLPDIEYDTLPPKGDCRHIVFAGDSFVFGDGVDREDSFVGQIRTHLEGQAQTPCFRVFNVSERATTIEQQAARIRENLTALQPDLIILGQYQNDLTDLTKEGFVAHETKENNWTDVRERLQLFNLDLIRLLSYHTFAFMIQNDIEYDTLKNWSVLENPDNTEAAEKLKGIYSELYRGLVHELRAKGIEFGVLIIPSKFDVLAGRYPEAAFFHSLAEEHEVPALPLLPVFKENRRTYPFLMYDGHLNETGNRMVSDSVLNWLFETDPPPFPVWRAPPARAILSTEE
jgi:alkylated DNA nucleotide flippase Atl1